MVFLSALNKLCLYDINLILRLHVVRFCGRTESSFGLILNILFILIFEMEKNIQNLNLKNKTKNHAKMYVDFVEKHGKIMLFF